MIKVETVAERRPPFRPVPPPVDRRFVGGNRTIAGSRLESFARRTVKIRERETSGEKSGAEWIQGLTWPLFTREPSRAVYQRLEMKSFFRANRDAAPFFFQIARFRDRTNPLSPLFSPFNGKPLADLMELHGHGSKSRRDIGEKWGGKKRKKKKKGARKFCGTEKGGVKNVRGRRNGGRIFNG